MLTLIMSVDADVFRPTIEVHNGFCTKGRDDEFAKDPVHLRPLRSPKFYAFKCHMDVLCTMGGGVTFGKEYFVRNQNSWRKT
jgi:hypothetical protein